jgi:ribA/ribD-fused uncharacterized protein
MKIKELTGTEQEYWQKVAGDYSVKYGMTVNDFRVYDKSNCITFNSSNRNTYVLSNLYPCTLTYDGTRFHSSEQLYFYLCTTTKPDIQRLVMQQPNAISVKKLHISAEDRNADWAQTRNKIMTTVLNVKYQQCPEYRNFLISTGDKDILEYAYWWDLYWGTSTTKNSNYYVGINALGRLHMLIRKQANKPL